MNPTPQTRREFLQAAGRLGLLGGIGLLGVSLFRPESVTAACINNDICINCRRQGNCELPAALNYREGQGKGNGYG
jgi:hypothetical protein